MMNKILIANLVASVALGLAAGHSSAATLSVVDSSDGTFKKLVPTSPGVYGLEARGGRQGAADWEIGVGTNTSVSGFFEEDKFFDDDWGNGSTFYDFMMTWDPGSQVSVSIGDSTVSYDADWLVGNGIEIFAKRSAEFRLTEIDGQVFNETVGGIGGSAFESLFIAGDDLLDGWVMKGEIAMTAGGGSANSVLVTTGTFHPNDTETVPEPTAMVGLVILGGLAAGRRLQKALA